MAQSIIKTPWPCTLRKFIRFALCAYLKFWRDNPGKKITGVMKSGYRAMPPVDVRADEIKAIIDHMEHSFKNKKGPGDEKV
jgi:hypothetical protein